MNLRHVEFSIVVVGQDCNPTILNPDFLRCRGIVPEDWGWEIDGLAITTPAFSTVPYKSNVVISVEPQKAAFLQRLQGEDPSGSKLAGIATRYIEILPHVRYTAVGVNFKGLFPQAAPESFLSDRFLKAGAWDTQEHRIAQVGLKLCYPLDGGRLTLSLDVAEAKETSGGAPKTLHGVRVSANFHRECQGYPSDGQARGHIGLWEADFEHYLSLAGEILER